MCLICNFFLVGWGCLISPALQFASDAMLAACLRNTLQDVGPDSLPCFNWAAIFKKALGMEPETCVGEFAHKPTSPGYLFKNYHESWPWQLMFLFVVVAA